MGLLLSRDRASHPLQQLLHVLPDLALALRFAQQIRRVVGDQNLAVAVAVEAAAELADGFGGLEEEVAMIGVLTTVRQADG